MSENKANDDDDDGVHRLNYSNNFFFCCCRSLVSFTICVLVSTIINSVILHHLVAFFERQSRYIAEASTIPHNCIASECAMKIELNQPKARSENQTNLLHPHTNNTLQRHNLFCVQIFRARRHQFPKPTHTHTICACTKYMLEIETRARCIGEERGGTIGSVGIFRDIIFRSVYAHCTHTHTHIIYNALNIGEQCVRCGTKL